MKHKTLVLGASSKPYRYSYRAIHMLTERDHEVVALGYRKGEVFGIAIETENVPFQHVDTVTLYLNPKRQVAYYEYIISLRPKRVIFNPGTENEEFAKMLEVNDIKWENACTLVLLASGQY